MAGTLPNFATFAQKCFESTAQLPTGPLSVEHRRQVFDAVGGIRRHINETLRLLEADRHLDVSIQQQLRLQASAVDEIEVHTREDALRFLVAAAGIGYLLEHCMTGQEHILRDRIIASAGWEANRRVMAALLTASGDTVSFAQLFVAHDACSPEEAEVRAKDSKQRGRIALAISRIPKTVLQFGTIESVHGKGYRWVQKVL